MKKYCSSLVLFVMAITLFQLTSCKKDDDGFDGGFAVHVPGSLMATSLIRVDMSVNCDVMPTVTFATESGALGVVSPTEDAKFGTPYVYADEPIDVNFTNGRATASFWYIPLTPGEHTVTFQVAYSFNGTEQTSVNRQTLNVADKPAGGFYPEVHTAGNNEFRQNLVFRNEVNNVYHKHKSGCAMYIYFKDVDGETDPISFKAEYWLTTNTSFPMEKGVFYSVNWGIYSSKWDDWGDGDGLSINPPEKDMTMNLIFRDDYNRCRDVRVDIVKRVEDDNIVTSTASEYYLWPRNKE